MILEVKEGKEWAESVSFGLQSQMGKDEKGLEIRMKGFLSEGKNVIKRTGEAVEMQFP